MIFTWLVLVILGILILSSIFDLKYKAVPSVILTTGIFTALLVHPSNLYFGIICLVFGILIKDLIDNVAGLDFGIADIKIFVIFGLLLTNFEALLIMIIIFLIFQFIYTLQLLKKIQEIIIKPCTIIMKLLKYHLMIPFYVFSVQVSFF